MLNELNERQSKFNIKLEDFENQPQSQAEKKERFLKILDCLRMKEIKMKLLSVN